MAHIERIEWKRLRDKLAELRAQPKDISTGLPASISYLQMLYSNAMENDKRDLLDYLGMEFSRYGMIAEEERVLRTIAHSYADDPTALIGLASFLRSEKAQYDAALAIVNEAISVARSQGTMIRYCYNERARVARAMNNYQLLSETLQVLLQLGPGDPRSDIGPEFDFVRDLPNGTIDADLLARYIGEQRNPQ